MKRISKITKMIRFKKTYNDNLFLLAKLKEEKLKYNNLKQTYEEINHEYNEFKTIFKPGHFYSPYPDLAEIKSREKNIFSKEKIDITGIDLNEKSQLSLADLFASFDISIPFKDKQKNDKYRYFYKNTAFTYTDGTILFYMLLHLKPSKLIEVGSGYSSALMMDVNEYYQNIIGKKIDITFIEPYPELLVSLMKEDDKYRIIPSNLSDVDESIFSNLGNNDVLFIDSTHVSKVGSDVNQLFLEILPKLNNGVIVHVHDVFYPFEYPKEWVYEGRAWNEDYILKAFLLNNKEWEIIFFNDFLFEHHNKKLSVLNSKSSTLSGGSIWLRKIK